MAAPAITPEPPYYAVIFTTVRTDGDHGYEAAAQHMLELAQQQTGFLGIDSARDVGGLGISVSYWADLAAIAHWKANAEHRIAQERGRSDWYAQHRLRIARVERDYGSSA